MSIKRSLTMPGRDNAQRGVHYRELMDDEEAGEDSYLRRVHSLLIMDTLYGMILLVHEDH